MRDDVHELPALQLGKRASLNDTHLIANLGFTIFVVSIELLALLDDLLELGMGNAGDVFHNDGLVHLGGNDNTDARLAKSGLFSRFSLFAYIAISNVYVLNDRDLTERRIHPEW